MILNQHDAHGTILISIYIFNEIKIKDIGIFNG